MTGCTVTTWYTYKYFKLNVHYFWIDFQESVCPADESWLQYDPDYSSGEGEDDNVQSHSFLILNPEYTSGEEAETDSSSTDGNQAPSEDEEPIAVQSPGEVTPKLEGILGMF